MNIIDSSFLAKTPPPERIAALRTMARAKDIGNIAADSVPADQRDCGEYFTLGAAIFDRAMAGGAGYAGLPLAALHEIYSAEAEDMGAASAFTLLCAERASAALQAKGSKRQNAPDRPILWARESRHARQNGYLYPPGLTELGIDPARILYVDAPDSIALLCAAADALRSHVPCAVIAELSGARPKGLDLTATRRLSLSAQKSGIPVFCLRIDAAPMASAAFSRWRIASAPAQPLEANAPGYPVFDVDLLRHRGGLEGLSARLEWHSEQKSFRDAPDIGAVPAVSGNGTHIENIRKRA
ncbi:ImuA family protein [Sphingorhabdus arenilitoris]|uniref:ImuA family protein n=1 Tax=Sphingorhabdus arenilitoris TaxID=1490041 RepID=A0ABV8RK04_9SPHN